MKKIKRFFFLIIAVALAFGTYYVWKNGFPEDLDLSQVSSVFSARKTAEDKYGWNLLLINKDNLIPDDYIIEPTVLSNGQSVDSRIYPYLQEMFNDMRKAGYSPFVASGYRTSEEQQNIMDEKIKAFIDEGNSKEDAEKYAKQFVAEPGTSEHQLGLAVDINESTSGTSSDEFYAWLESNAHKYGFIMRYPADKSDLTGTLHEPWHYRYVEIDAANEIYSQKICLEEYIDKLDNKEKE